MQSKKEIQEFDHKIDKFIVYTRKGGFFDQLFESFENHKDGFVGRQKNLPFQQKNVYFY